MSKPCVCCGSLVSVYALEDCLMCDECIMIIYDDKIQWFTDLVLQRGVVNWNFTTEEVFTSIKNPNASTLSMYVGRQDAFSDIKSPNPSWVITIVRSANGGEIYQGTFRWIVPAHEYKRIPSMCYDIAKNQYEQLLYNAATGRVFCSICGNIFYTASIVAKKGCNLYCSKCLK